jgi:hypothetical protein
VVSICQTSLPQRDMESRVARPFNQLIGDVSGGRQKAAAAPPAAIVLLVVIVVLMDARHSLWGRMNGRPVQWAYMCDERVCLPISLAPLLHRSFMRTLL